MRYELTEFASFIRQKYPEKSAKFDDETLVEKFLKKHPEGSRLLRGEDWVRLNNKMQNAGREIFTGENVQPQPYLQELKDTAAQSSSDFAKRTLRKAITDNTMVTVPTGLASLTTAALPATSGYDMRPRMVPDELSGMTPPKEVPSPQEAYRSVSQPFRQLVESKLPQPEAPAGIVQEMGSSVLAGFSDPAFTAMPGVNSSLKPFAKPLANALANIGIEIPADVAIGLAQQALVSGELDLSAKNVLTQGGTAAAIRGLLRSKSFIEMAKDAEFRSLPDAPEGSIPLDEVNEDAIEALSEADLVNDPPPPPPAEKTTKKKSSGKKKKEAPYDPYWGGGDVEGGGVEIEPLPAKPGKVKAKPEATPADPTIAKIEHLTKRAEYYRSKFQEAIDLDKSGPPKGIKAGSDEAREWVVSKSRAGHAASKYRNLATAYENRVAVLRGEAPKLELQWVNKRDERLFQLPHVIESVTELIRRRGIPISKIVLNPKLGVTDRLNVSSGASEVRAVYNNGEIHINPKFAKDPLEFREILFHESAHGASEAMRGSIYANRPLAADAFEYAFNEGQAALSGIKARMKMENGGALKRGDIGNAFAQTADLLEESYLPAAVRPEQAEALRSAINYYRTNANAIFNRAEKPPVVNDPLKPSKKLAGSVASDSDLIVVDNPGGEWEKGNPEAVTAYSKEPVLTNPKKVKRLAETVPVKYKTQKEKISDLAEAMTSNGWEDGSVIHVLVDKDGNATVTDGNHRLNAAIKAGVDQVPVSYTFQGGGENRFKLFSIKRTPDNIAENSPGLAVTMIKPDTDPALLPDIAKDIHTSTKSQKMTFEQLDNNPAAQKVMAILNEEYGWKRRKATANGQHIGWELRKPRPEKPKEPFTGRDDATTPAPLHVDDARIEQELDQLTDGAGWTQPESFIEDAPKGGESGSVGGFARHLKPVADVLKEGGLVSRIVGKKLFRAYAWQTRAEADAVYWVSNVFSRMSNADQKLVRDIVTNRVKPDSTAFKLASSEIKDAAIKAKEVLDEIFRRAESNKVTTVDGQIIQRLNNFWPTQKFEYDPQFRGFNPRNGVFSSSLEMHRNPFKPPEYPEEQIAENLLSYIRNSYQKIGEVREFGNDAKATAARLKDMAQPLLQNGDPNPNYIGTANDESQYVQMILDKFLLADERGLSHGSDQKAIQGLTNFVTGSMLGASGPINLTQSIYAGHLYGYKNYLNAVRLVGSKSPEAKWAKDMLAKSGALTDTEVMGLSFNKAPFAKFAQTMLSWNNKGGVLSMSGAEIFNRQVSGLAALNRMEENLLRLLKMKEAASSLAPSAKLQAEKKISKLSSELKEHGVDVNSAINSRSLSNSDKLNILLVGSNKAQHSTDPMSVPMSWDKGDVMGTVATKFLKYPLKQGWRLKKDILNGSAADGLSHVAKLFTVGTATQAAGLVLSDALKLRDPMRERDLPLIGKADGPVAVVMDAMLMTFLADTAIYKLTDALQGDVSGLPHIKQLATVANFLNKYYTTLYETGPMGAAGVIAETLGKAFNIPGSAILREMGKEMQGDNPPTVTKLLRGM